MSDAAYNTANTFVNRILLSDTEGDFHPETRVEFLNFENKEKLKYEVLGTRGESLSRDVCSSHIIRHLQAGKTIEELISKKCPLKSQEELIEGWMASIKLRELPRVNIDESKDGEGRIDWQDEQRDVKRITGGWKKNAPTNTDAIGDKEQMRG